MEVELLKELNSQLVAIKWIVIIQGVCILGLLGTVGYFLNKLIGDGALNARIFRAEASDLSDAGDYESLKALALDRLENYKNDKWALYYLGISYLRLEDYAAAKARFNRVRELDPTWEESVISYLDEIDEKLAPKLVQ
ncbi:MAG: tetratricopeptide repeat protein [Pseudomonadota bacterium]